MPYICYTCSQVVFYLFFLVIYCSEEFISHYTINPENDYCFTPIEPNPLETIVISTSNEEFLKWITKNKEFGLGY